MIGESSLTVLLKNMKPVLNSGEFVFCCVQKLENVDIKEIVCFFREEEGITIIVSKTYADKIGLNYSFNSSWITFKIHSSLEAVGFTTAFSKALSDEGIGCNVVAAFYHDHIFTNKTFTSKVMQILENLAN